MKRDVSRLKRKKIDKKHPTPVVVSIGISAYNEEANIKKILKTLLGQKEKGFILKEIIVALDGSTDKTKEKIKSIKDKRIQLIDGFYREGKSARLNQIFKSFQGDILVIVDADVIIADKHLLAKLISKSNLKKDGLVSVNVTPVQAQTFFEHVIHSGVFIVKDIAKLWQNGENYLSFRGCLMVLNKKLAKSLYMPQRLVNDDTFLYLSALNHRYVPRYFSDLFVYYKSPTTLRDHINQSSRYRNSREEMEQHFDLDFEDVYQIPLLPRLVAAMKYGLLQPWYFLPYLAVLGYTKLAWDKKTTGIWKMALSTK